MRVFILVTLMLWIGFAWAASSEKDALKPNPVIETIWGPDAFGYIALDSNEPNGPPVEWIDISGIGTVVPGLGDDNIVGPFNTGFNFRYYWYDVTSFYVGSNGYIRFSGGGQLSDPFTSIPNPAAPNDIICPYTADFDPGTAGTVYYWSNNVDTLIVSWDHIPAWLPTGSSGDHNFQIVLSMVDTSITFNIGPQSGTFSNTNGMVGIEDLAGNIGIYNYPSNAVPANYSIKFYYPPVILIDIHDMAVTRVQNNNSGGFFVQTGGTLQANATIKNTGNQNESDFYAIAEVRQYPSNTLVEQDSFYVAAINAGEALEITFSETWTLPNTGNYYLRVKTALAGDMVASNDQIDVEMHVLDLPGELYFDDGSAEQTWAWNGGFGGMAVYYVPPVYPAKITQIRGYLGAGTTSTFLEIYDDDGPDGQPGSVITSFSVTATTAGWFSIDLSDSNFVIQDGGVYPAWRMNGTTSSAIGLDQNTIASRQTWEYTGVWAVFRNFTTDDAMLRISVEESMGSALAQPGVCYASTGLTDGGRLITIDPTTGVGTVIGPTGVPNNGMPGLAINSAGVIYGTDRTSGDLYRVNAATGAATFVASTGISFLDGIAFDANDVLYGVSYDAPDFTLIIIDTLTGATTPVGPTGDVYIGLAFDPTNGDLYASVGGYQPINPDAIAKIDPATGAATIIGTTGLAGTYGNATPDLHFDQAGNLFGVKGGGQNPNVLISIDKNTGAGTVIGDSIGVRAVSGLATRLQATGPQAAKLLITEIVVTPTAGEFIEIYNPNSEAVDLSNIYVTDATFAGDSTYYYRIVEGGGGGGGFGDFNARFPDGAMITSREHQTIALNGDSAFFATYSEMPTYELYEDGHANPSDAPDMREAVPGSINNQGGLTNSDEVVILYYWNGLSDLVVDVDYLLYNSGSPTPNNEAVDKTGVRIDGPDPGTDSTMYLPDTPIANQLSALNHSGGFSVQRSDYNEGAQTMSGGNGVTGADETSEDLNNTFTNGYAPTPNDSLIIVGVEDLPAIPMTFAISQNYPNPFNPITSIKYQLPQATHVTLTIYNLLGQKVRTLVNDRKEPGYYEIEWNGLNDHGVRVATGLYIYRIKANDFMQSKKMILMK